jgi:replicative DNA helicase
MNAEHKIIATLARYPGLLPSLSISSTDFQDIDSRRMFEAITKLISNNNEPDPLLVAEELGQCGDREWLPQVMKVFQEVGVPANVLAYQDIVKKQKRQFDSLAVIQQAQQEIEQNIPDANIRLIENLRKLDESAVKQAAHISNFTQGILARADAIARGDVKQGLSTGIRDLDRLTGGLNGGDSIIIAARTSVGKTAFMCNLAVNINVPCGIVSGEQSGMQIANRILARMGNISAHRLKTGHLNADELKSLVAASVELKDLKIHIIDQPRPSIEDIERVARGLHWEFGIEALFIDYLQLVTNRAYPDKRHQVSDISARCKALARELDIPVIVLAQLNRSADDKEHPRLSHLKESGSIEEDADLVMLLYKDSGEPQKLTIDLQKHRDGMTGHVNVRFDAEHMTAHNL